MPNSDPLDFENLFNEDDEDSNEGGEMFFDDSKRLMLDAITQKSVTVSDLYNSTTRLVNSTHIDVETTKAAKKFLLNLMEESKNSIDQLDYFISRMLDETEGGLEQPGEN